MTHKIRLTANKLVLIADVDEALLPRLPDLPSPDIGWWWKVTKDVYEPPGSFLDLGGSALSDEQALELGTFLKERLEDQNYEITLEVVPPEEPTPL